jgi:hypothetical protein
MSARIALLDILHMPAQSGCTAVADRCESFPLMRAEHMAPASKELLFVGAEHIGHFEPMLSHLFLEGEERTRSIEPSVSSGLLVERTAVSER